MIAPAKTEAEFAPSVNRARSKPMTGTLMELALVLTLLLGVALFLMATDDLWVRFSMLAPEDLLRNSEFGGDLLAGADRPSLILPADLQT